MVPELNRWRCERHEEGPVLMSSPHKPVCWVCRHPMEPAPSLTIVDAPFGNPMLAFVHALGGADGDAA